VEIENSHYSFSLKLLNITHPGIQVAGGRWQVAAQVSSCNLQPVTCNLNLGGMSNIIASQRFKILIFDK
jgi:hypothetical protein